MPNDSRSASWHPLLAGVLVALFLAQSFLASLRKSPVYDEPPHIASGLSYLSTGVFRANPQHPPLLKELSALFLLAAGIRWPQTADARALIAGNPDADKAEWPIGNQIIASNGPDRVLFWARLPFILLAGLLGLTIYLFGRELVGSAAALGALFLYAFDPTILAHSYLVTTDAGLAALGLVFFWMLWRYLQNPTRRRLLVCGLAMGAMLGAKFSAPFFVLAALILLLASAARAQPAAARVAPNSPCPCGSGRKYKKCHGAKGAAKTSSAPWLPRLGAFLVLCALAGIVVEALYFFPHDPFLYFAGLRAVNADHPAGYQYYFHGDIATRFPFYFAAAWLLKEPLASLVLAAAGLGMLLRSHSMPRLTKLFVVLPPFLFFLGMAIFADDMGVRYLVPALPFAYLLGGMALAALWRGARAWSRPAALVLCLWMVVEAAGIYPDHLSYFNEAACLPANPAGIGWDGGSRCGPLWLDDSNVDWGQGLKQLRAWQQIHPAVPALRLAYPGTFPPEAYGLQFEPFLTHQLFPEPAPGWYAVSAHQVARIPVVGARFEHGGAAWLRQRAPVAIVGHAFYIYRVP